MYRGWRPVPVHAESFSNRPIGLLDHSAVLRCPEDRTPLEVLDAAARLIVFVVERVAKPAARTADLQPRFWNSAEYPVCPGRR